MTCNNTKTVSFFYDNVCTPSIQEGVVAQPNDPIYTGAPTFRFAINNSGTNLVLTNYLDSNGHPITIPFYTSGTLNFDGKSWSFTKFTTSNIMTPPTANAGVDQTISTTTTTLNGIGSGNAITYLWTQLTGATAAITSPTTASTAITGLTVGSYSFRLTVTQSDLQTASDDINITVNTLTDTVYYGYNSNGSIPASPSALPYSKSSPIGADTSIDYTAILTPSYLIMAELKTEPIKTKWYVSGANNGGIDAAPGGSNLFYYVEQGIYRIYITNYLTTITDAPVQFKIV